MTNSSGERRFLSRLLLVILGVLLLLNFFLPKNLVILSGEYLFSFDYLAHAKQLLSHYLFSSTQNVKLAQCVGCPAFYHVSAWHSLFVQILLSIGQVLDINPFIFDLGISIITQSISFFFLIKALKLKFNKYSFAIALIFFCFNPHKFYLIPSATKDGVIYAFLVTLISTNILYFRQLPTLSLKKLVAISTLIGLTLSFFLNIAISHFPIALYIQIVFLIINIKTLVHTFKKSALSISLIAIIPLILNFPLLISLIISGSSHHLTNFHSLSFIDSLTAGLTYVNTSKAQTIVVLLITTLLAIISPLKKSTKYLLLVIYIFTAFFLTGFKVGSIYYYQYMFDYLPFMTHMRSLYRLFFFQTLIVSLFIYSGMTRLMKLKTTINRSMTVIASFILVLSVQNYINHNVNLFHYSLTPLEYFQTNKYLLSLTGKKIYFPPYWSSSSPNISGNYTWIRDQPRNPTLYTNPFTSFFAVNDMINFESVYLSPSSDQLRSAIDLSRPSQEIKSALEYLGIKYLILDKNYLWEKNFPEFQLTEFTSGLKLIQTYNNIFVYELNDRSVECRPSYGDYKLGYCYSNHPKVLINKTPLDFYLDQLVQNDSMYKINLNRLSRTPDFIVDVPLRDRLFAKGILVPFTVFHVDNNKEEIFTAETSTGDYELFIPYLKVRKEDYQKDSKIEVLLNDQSIYTVNPIYSREGFAWERVSFRTELESELVISTSGQGKVILGSPLLIPSEEWNNLSTKIINIPTIQSD